jgi:hypothetical protein
MLARTQEQRGGSGRGDRPDRSLGVDAGEERDDCGAGQRGEALAVADTVLRGDQAMPGARTAS